MKTIAFINQKGGTGKSSLAASLAVAALEADEKPFVIDLDPQGTVFSWGERRKAETPAVDRARAAQLVAVLDALDKQGYTLAVIDTQGADVATSSEVMRCANLTLIPARPTVPDIEASKPTISSLTALGRPYAFVLNQCPTTASSARATDAARALDLLGVLAQPMMGMRTDHQDAIALGQGVTERDPNGKAAREMRDLWLWIKKKLKDQP
jgi:chromosome partitioning protein